MNDTLQIFDVYEDDKLVSSEYYPQHLPYTLLTDKERREVARVISYDTTVYPERHERHWKLRSVTSPELRNE